MAELNKLYPLDEKDIQAIGNTRVTRAEGNKQTYLTIGAMLVMVAGVFVAKSSALIGWVFLIVGAAGAVYYMNKLSKKQKDVVERLLIQWRTQAK